MGLTLKWSIERGDRFRELEYRHNGVVWAIIWDANKAIDIGEWLICGGGGLERVYCTSKLSLNLAEIHRLSPCTRVGVRFLSY